ncbi:MULTISPECIES: hypothetical protein [Myxococcus]|uniref:Uncharacterized protein n=1 Tax=Myxococcus virescens TaxID=83456 RepID=A0A511HF19_9BACT|nr:MULTISPECIES: hypothetical protein [Myxococcus]GEL72146.1 hypothetical protein MVI01_39300 [Myxococcus virescens]SDE84534.1 hypothetical protein SAMN04488504_11345 [Myxococcus virescens]
MQLRKMMLVLTALGAMSGLMAGCGDDSTSPGACTSNDECGESEICHPTAQVCVQTCNSGSDCPSTAKTCAPLGGTGPSATTNICQCSTDVLCNGGTDSESTGLVCSNLDNVCVTACSTDAQCSGDRTCNTTTGQCEEGDTEPVPGESCTGEGRSTCGYGLICTSSTCSEPPAPTCQNYTAYPNKAADVGTTGPIIYDMATVNAVAGTTAWCPGAKRLRLSVSAYTDAASPFPQTAPELGSFYYVRTDGSRINAVISNGANDYVITQNGTRADIIVNLCVPADSTTTLVGYHFGDGNFFCFRSNY